MKQNISRAYWQVPLSLPGVIGSTSLTHLIALDLTGWEDGGLSESHV